MHSQSTVLRNAVRAASVTRDVEASRGGLTALPGMAERLLAGRRLAIVADRQTMRAAGEATAAALAGQRVALAEPIIVDGHPRVRPRTDTAREIAERLRALGAAPIAVGSGVVNDLAKYAAHVAGVPYIAVATAASMDGYAASGAALLDDGFKRTLACAPPVAVVADIDIVAAAPARMAAWGFGDLAGKVTAGLDWRLADALGEEPINAEPFAMVQDNLGAWLSRPGAIAAGDPSAIADLLGGLLVSGFAMQAHGGSRPASGCEHLISHVWEMERLTINGEPAAHGACVGVGTIAILALYEWFLAQDVGPAAARRALVAAPSADDIEKEIAQAFPDPNLADSARAEMAIKASDPARRRRRLTMLVERWPELRAELQRHLVGAVDMAAALRASGAATHPGELGASLQKLAVDIRRARLIRRRYTLLDALDDLGWLGRATAAVASDDALWSAHKHGATSAAS